jgi:hypothetical protein
MTIGTVGLAEANSQLSELLVQDAQGPQTKEATLWRQRLGSFHAGQPNLAGSAVLLEFAGVVALAVQTEFECFLQERLSLLEPLSGDDLQVRQWLQQRQGPPIR